MLTMLYQPMGFDLGAWRLWRGKCLEALRQAYAPQGQLVQNVALGPREAGHRRPRADAVLRAPNETFVIVVKRRPSLADLDRLERLAQLLRDHPRWPQHADLPVRSLLAARTLDLHVAEAAHERGIVLHQAGSDGRLLDVPRTRPRRGAE